MSAKIGWVILLAGLAILPPVAAHDAVAGKGMVASVHPLATQAGLKVLQNGGNAIDAAVAVGLTLGVVDGHNSGIGGGCFILIRRAGGDFVAIDGRETAPAAAHRNMFQQDGAARPEWSQTGPLAVATPGALAAYALAVQRFGSKPLPDLLTPAAELAERGFELDRIYARKLRSSAGELAQFAGSRQMLLDPLGEPFPEGHRLALPDLAATYRAIAREGSDWFYRGPFARRVDTWMREQGGILRAEDFAAYEPRQREPLVTTYRGYTIVGFPPPSSGGVHVAQMLHMLEPFDLAAMHAEDPAEFVHVLVEAMKLAFADRAYWLGDPDHAPVPRGLIDPDYARQLHQRIDRRRASPVPTHGQPPAADQNLFGRHTTHFTAADVEGNWVAITATVNTTFGSKVVVPGTGVVLNNEMDDFSIQPGVPNAFGLLGAEANAVAAGKRPLSSMSPTLVLRDGQPVLTVGAAGGPTIITQVLLTLVRCLDLKMSLPEALAAPRFHHQWSPDQLVMEAAWPEPIREGLRRRGHSVRQVEQIGVSQGIAWDEPSHRFHGASDPRVPGQAAGPAER